MKISVIIPAHNEEKFIGETLREIVEAAPQNLLEIIVVNNASDDRTAEVASAFEKVKVVTEPKKGLTIARQAGLNAASGDLLAYVDADTHISKDWFRILNREFSNDPDLVCLSGPYVYYGFTKAKNWLVSFWYLVGKFFSIFSGYLVQGGNFVLKKEAVLKMGGFDPNISFYGEDTDIGRRIHKFGKVKFLMGFKAVTSPRRFEEEGLLKIGWLYAANFFSVMLTKKPATEKYRDIR